MSKGARILSYAVRLQVVAHLSGLLCWTLILLVVPPCVVALVHGETGFAARLAVILVTLTVLGFAGSRVELPTPRLNEVMVVSALAFVVPPLFMGWALTAFGIDGTRALFEAVSGITTTGLSVLGPAEDLPATVLFTRAWMQWFGGLGFVVLALGLTSGALQTVARRLGAAEEVAQDPLGSLRTRARRTLFVYSGLTLASFVSLWASGVTAWHALLLCLAALSTGGFAFDQASAAAIDGWIPRAVLMLSSVLGAMSLSIYLHALRRRPLGARLRADLVGFIGMLVVTIGGLAYFLTLGEGASSPDVLRHALFVGASAQTTTGFSTLDTSALPTPALLWLILAMLAGGNTGSTAGGLKTDRVLALVAVVRLTLQRPSLPEKAVVEPSVEGDRIGVRELQGVVTVLALALLTILGAWAVFLAEGHGLDGLFEVVSATTTTGLSTGVVGPDLAPSLQLVLSLAMMLGRLEFVALLVLLWPMTWFGQRYRS